MRIAEPSVEAAIAYNLVDLALAAPQNAFLDIARSFSTMSRNADPEDARFESNLVRRFILFHKTILTTFQILTAQTRLARELRQRPDLRDSYLQELLLLFSDKGVGIQVIATSHQHRKVNIMAFEVFIF